MLSVFHVTVFLALMSAGSTVLIEDSLDNLLEDTFTENVSKNNIPHATLTQEEASMPGIMAHLMAEYETTAESARNIAQLGVLPQDEIEEHYIKMAQLLEDIIDQMDSDNNAYIFLRAKGLDVVIAPNMHISFSQVRSQLLQLLKTLFDVAPTTTLSVIPDTILDGVLDIYEQDDDLDIKLHAMELLQVWLPGNPKAQTQVMKMKGLVPFYKQLETMDPLLTRHTLELFNKILNEHIAVRNKKLQKNKADFANFQLYQQMGLIERLSTPMVCNGLLNIFEALFSNGPPNQHVLQTVLTLLHIIKPHCARVYNGRSKAAVLIDQILEELQDQSILSELEGVNITEAIESMTEFAKLVKVREHTDL